MRSLVSGSGLFCGIVALNSVFGAGQAIAAPINYGDFSGLTVHYRSVTEDSATDPLPLFGAPTLAGDALDFNPTSFVSSSSGGAFDSTIGTLDMTIEAKPTRFIDVVTLSEAGDYTIFGTGGLDTSATVSAAVFINITEVDGIGITPVNLNANMVFTPSNGDYNLQDDGAGFGVIWTGLLDVDITQALVDASQPFSLGATEVKLVMNNILVTTSEAGSSAEIQKKDFQGFSITVVPEPTMLALLSLGAAVVVRRR